MKRFARWNAKQCRWWAKQWDNHPYRMVGWLVVSVGLQVTLRLLARPEIIDTRGAQRMRERQGNRPPPRLP